LKIRKACFRFLEPSKTKKKRKIIYSIIKIAYFQNIIQNTINVYEKILTTLITSQDISSRRSLNDLKLIYFNCTLFLTIHFARANLKLLLFASPPLIYLNLLTHINHIPGRMLLMGPS